MNTNPRSNAGFSLIELMVALVAGLIVSGAVLAFTLSSLRSNSDYIQSTRLTQELRTAIDYIDRELRRAGYDESSLGFYAQDPKAVLKVSSFSAIYIENPTTDPADPEPEACVIYAYDLGQPSTPGESPVLDDGEIRGIRMVETSGIGVIEVAQSATGLTPSCTGDSPDYTKYPVGCNATSGWCPLTDHRVIDIASFVVDTDGSWDVPAVGATTSALDVRSLWVNLRGSLLSSADVVRDVQTRIRVRSDCLQGNTACTTAPVGVAK